MPEYKQISGFFGGLNLLGRGDTVKDTELTFVKNLTVKKDSLVLDTGYIVQTTGISGDFTIKAVYELLDLNGTRHSFLFTKVKVYHWSANAWAEVKDDAGASLSLTGSDLLPIIAVSYAVSDNTVDNSQVIWTNGVDDPHKLYNDGGTWKCDTLDTDGAGAGPAGENINACRCLAVWNDMVWMANTDENGVETPYMIRYSKPNDESEWGSGGAGLYELGGGDAILQMEILGAHLIVYREYSIWRGTWTGSYAQPVIFEEVISNEGVHGGIPVANMNDWHCIIGKSNVYKYSGGLSLEPMGDYVHSRIYEDDGILDLNYKDYIRAEHIKETDSLWLMFPIMDSGGDTYTYVIRYHIKYKAWSERKIELFVTSLDKLHLEEDDTWGGATGRDGTWAAEGVAATGNEGEAIGAPRAWLSQVFLYDFPYIFMSVIDETKKSKLIIYDYQQTKDGVTGEYSDGEIRITAGTGTEIPWEFRTKNFSAGSGRIRVEHFQLSIAGTVDTNINCYYSINDGVSWNSLNSFALQRDESNTEEFQRYFIWMNVSTENIMFKFSGQGGGVKFGSGALGYFSEPM